MGNPPRRPAGSPRSTGGQYAPELRGESDLDLTGRTSTAVLDRDATDLDPEYVREIFNRTDDEARAADRRTGISRRIADLDAEDVRQEALLQWWSDRLRGGRTIDNDAGYARTVAHFTAAKYGDRMRAEDRRANRILAGWVVGFEQDHRRHPTVRERDEQAAQIRRTWPDRRHLPTADFHHRNLTGQETSWSGWIGEDGDDLLANLAEAGVSSSVHSLRRPGMVSDPTDVDETRIPASVAPGSWTAAALSLAEGINGEPKRRQVQARRICCAALAESRRAPMPKVGCLSHAAVSAGNTRLQRYPGGVPGAIATWRAGESDAGTEALFAPFGTSLDEGQRDEICDLLELGEPKTLWNSAAWVADEHNTDTVRRIVARAS